MILRFKQWVRPWGLDMPYDTSIVFETQNLKCSQEINITICSHRSIRGHSKEWYFSFPEATSSLAQNSRAFAEHQALTEHLGHLPSIPNEPRYTSQPAPDLRFVVIHSPEPQLPAPEHARGAFACSWFLVSRPNAFPSSRARQYPQSSIDIPGSSEH